jgi:hypothetical protein
MAKKVRRVKKGKRPELATESTTASEKTAEKVAAAKETSAEAFQQEYAYVVRDLRRVLLLSGAMFVLLIALNLLLR